MAFADLTELENRLDFDLDERGKRNALAKLQEASDLARYYGLPWPDAKVPAVVKAIVLNVVERYMRNPDAYTVSRAADETVQWSDLGGMSFFFADEEKDILGGLKRPPAMIGSVSTYAWRSQPLPTETVYVPVEGGSPFPLFNGSESFR